MLDGRKYEIFLEVQQHNGTILTQNIKVTPACAVVVEVAAVAVVHREVHAALRNAVDLTVHREVFQLHFRIKDALPQTGVQLAHRLRAVT